MRGVYEKVRKIYESINQKRVENIENTPDREYRVGEKVLVYDPTTKVGLSRKMTVRWKGPYMVSEKINDVNYIVDMGGNMAKIHTHRMRPYHSTPTALDFAISNTENLQAEIDRINDLELELRVQKTEKKHQLEIAEAQQVVAANVSKDEKSVAENVILSEDVTENDIRFQSCACIHMLF